MKDISAETVVVSAGFNKTHVTTAAAEASARGSLQRCITGAYPTPTVTLIANALRLNTWKRVGRLLERGERMPDERVRSLLLPEVLYDVARALAGVPYLKRWHARLCAATWRLYGRRASGELRRSGGAQIYHFRAGFGQSSLPTAKELGMVTVCDHSLAHPQVLGGLVAEGGRLPADLADCLPPDDALGQAILADIEAADAVVVNSDFVKETFRAAGAPTDPVHVVYLGVDDNFLRAVPQEPREPEKQGPLRMLFAGAFDRRKGAEVLIEALTDLPDTGWELRIAGVVPVELRRAHPGFFKDERVALLGTLRRPDLMREMRSAPVLVHPSLAEGSARVVFEALACGCYVVTTPNAGTIVEDGTHGALVGPGDAEGLRDAITRAGSARARLAVIGNRNARLIRERFTQAAYGNSLAALYDSLSTSHEP